MKKLILVLLAMGLFASCQKKSPQAASKTQAVTFGVTEVEPGTLKSDKDTWICSNTIPDRVWVQIDGVDYYAQLTTVGGKLYTQSIQLSPGPHTINLFVLYKETDGVTGVTGVDEIVFGIPESGSDYAIYVNKSVEFPIEVASFEKTEVPVEVLCFHASVYKSFGYNWFAIDKVVVREQCFFGDFCTKHFKDYEGSDYAKQATGLHIDMPAIFQIKVSKKQSDSLWIPLANGGVFTNDNEESGWGVGAPVCVQYPDNIGSVDSLKFELFILVKQGADFNFVLFHTWFIKDAEMIPAGSDGVVDFELGNCNIGSADLQLPPYINLPAEATLKMNNTIPSTTITKEGLPGYFDIDLSDIGPGFDIANGKYPANCFRIKGGINNSTHPVTVKSSLYPELMGSETQKLPWDKANWLMNHLADYPGHTWSDVQQALWMLEDPAYNGDSTCEKKPAPISDIGRKMVADANLLGRGFVPAPGDLVAVAFERITGNGSEGGGNGESGDGTDPNHDPGDEGGSCGGSGGSGQGGSGGSGQGGNHDNGSGGSGESGGGCNDGGSGCSGDEGSGHTGQKGKMVKYIFIRIDP